MKKFPPTLFFPLLGSYASPKTPVIHFLCIFLDSCNVYSREYEYTFLFIFKHKKYILMILHLVYIYIYIFFFLCQCSIKSFLILSDSYKIFYYMTISLLI